MADWIKRGLVFCPQQNRDWNQSHAQLPIVDPLSEQVWRIYYSCRDRANNSRFSYIEVQAGKPEHVLRIAEQPLLQLGDLGSFDESGQMCVSVVGQAGVKYLYYAGWSEKRHVPYHNAIGLAISHDDGVTFRKYAPGPLLDSRPFEPYFSGTACVRIENGVWRMWYQSCTRWQLIKDRPEPFYHIKYAESDDGIHWHREGRIAIDYKDSSEAGICSASILLEGQVYKMWYCFRQGEDYRHDRSRSYRIGYAESNDGISWQRMDDQASIDVSENGWDSEMLAYPNVISHRGRKYLFYNGNGFGRCGFGYAIQE